MKKPLIKRLLFLITLLADMTLKIQQWEKDLKINGMKVILSDDSAMSKCSRLTMRFTDTKNIQ